MVATEPLPMVVKVVKTALDAAVPPIAPGLANVAPFSVAALIDVLQPNPVFVVHWIALPEVEQDGMDNAEGTAEPLVALPRSVLVPMVSISASATAPKVGAPLAFP